MIFDTNVLASSGLITEIDSRVLNDGRYYMYLVFLQTNILLFACILTFAIMIVNIYFKNY